MNREEIFQWLEANGYTCMEVKYSGGHDEGFIDTPELSWIWSEQPPPPTLPAAIEAAVEEFCGCFIWEELQHPHNGPGSCGGRLIWTVATRQIVDKGYEMVEQTFEKEV